jgi:hypothetical protein
MNFEYKIIERWPYAWTVQMFFGHWMYLNENGYFYENVGGIYVFDSYECAETVMYLTKSGPA